MLSRVSQFASRGTDMVRRVFRLSSTGTCLAVIRVKEGFVVCSDTRGICRLNEDPGWESDFIYIDRIERAKQLMRVKRGLSKDFATIIDGDPKELHGIFPQSMGLGFGCSQSTNALSFILRMARREYWRTYSSESPRFVDFFRRFYSSFDTQMLKLCSFPDFDSEDEKSEKNGIMASMVLIDTDEKASKGKYCVTSLTLCLDDVDRDLVSSLVSHPEMTPDSTIDCIVEGSGSRAFQDFFVGNSYPKDVKEAFIKLPMAMQFVADQVPTVGGSVRLWLYSETSKKFFFLSERPICGIVEAFISCNLGRHYKRLFECNYVITPRLHQIPGYPFDRIYQRTCKAHDRRNDFSMPVQRPLVVKSDFEPGFSRTVLQRFDGNYPEYVCGVRPKTRVAIYSNSTLTTVDDVLKGLVDWLCSPASTQQSIQIVRVLITILDTFGDPMTLAVACYNVSQFIQYHPSGRIIVSYLKAKERAMKLMNHENDEVDGMDALAVKQACKFAKEHALKNGPLEHDPIERIRKLILSHELASATELKDMENEIRKEVDDVPAMLKPRSSIGVWC